MAFVELSDNKGWIVESAKERAVLEKSAGGHFMMENITGKRSPSCSRCRRIYVRQDSNQGHGR